MSAALAVFRPVELGQPQRGRWCPCTRSPIQKIFFLCLAASLLTLTGIETVRAQAALSLFQSATQAQQHCPNDTVVWLDLRRKIYYLPRQAQYGRGRTATFVCREEARRNGNRRALMGRR
jgi:hypothetical protein